MRAGKRESTMIHTRGQRKVRQGRVVSDRMNKTVVVAVERKIAHPLYKKIIRKNKKLVAHDEQNECRLGDIVQVMETRPLSRTKHWRVTKVLERAQ
jgi:small subunit ribosomal protein S17